MAEHGTTSRYTQGCRCGACKTAKARYDKRRHADAQDLGRRFPRLIPHGSAAGYGHWGCRCDPCRHGAAARRPSRARAVRE